MAALVREEMTTPLEKRLGLQTPLKVDVSVGPDGTLTVSVNIDDPRPAGSTGMTQALLGLTYDPTVVPQISQSFVKAVGSDGAPGLYYPPTDPVQP